MRLIDETDPRKVLADALAWREEWEQKEKAEVRQLEEEVRRLERRADRHQDRAVRRALLPDEAALNKILRYESHLGRQMLQALHTLERLQKTRAGQLVPAPVAVDVNVPSDAEPAAEFVR